MLLAILCTIPLPWQATIAVHINATRGVATKKQNVQVVFPCNYTLDDRSHSANIKWRCGDETVLVRDSLGQVRPGRKYRGRADMDIGCSLVLRNPRPSDTNLYTVRVIVPRDKHSEEQQDVFLVVSDSLWIPKTSTHSSLEKTTSNDTIVKTKVLVRWRANNTHDVVYFVCVIIYGAVWLLIHFLSLCKNACSGRISVAVISSKETSFWWKLSLVSTVVLLLVGTIMCIIGLIRHDWILSLASVPITLMGTFVCVLCLILDGRRPGMQASTEPREMAKKTSNRKLINANGMDATDDCIGDTLSAV